MSCPECFKGVVIPGTPRGRTLEDGTYVAEPSGAKQSNQEVSKAVVILTDIFGFSIPNPKILADQFADRLGVDVYVADLFNGSPIATPASLQLPDRAGYKRTFFEKVKLIFTLIRHLPALVANRPSVVDPRTSSLVTKLRSEKGYKRIGAIGYCFGGGVAVRLGQPTYFDTLLVAHPSTFSDNQLNNMTVPVSFACAEDDEVFNEKRRREVEANLKKRDAQYEFKVYEGTAHGYAARPNLALPFVKKAFEETIEQTASWFEKTL